MKITPYILLLLIFAGCDSENSRTVNPNPVGGHLSYTERGIVNTFFPHSITEITSSRVIDQIYDGLVMQDPVSMEVRPSLSASWKISGDGLEYRFNLRSDAYFHDDPCFAKGRGRKITASDFVFTFSLLATPDENNKNYSTFIETIEGAEEFYLKGGINAKGNVLPGVIAENDSTLIIKLKRPSGALLYNLANPVASVVPKAGFEKYGYRNFVGCGPFYTKGLSADNQTLKLYRFPYYYLKDNQGQYYPYADSATVYLATPLARSLGMLQSGEIQFIQNMPSSELAKFLESNINLFQSPDPVFIAQVSQVLPEWQDVISSKLKNYYSNNLGMLPLYQMYVKK